MTCSKGYLSPHPEMYPPDMPIRVVEVKGPSELSALSGETFYYNYATATVDAITGEVMGQSYYYGPWFIP